MLRVVYLKRGDLSLGYMARGSLKVVYLGMVRTSA